MSKPVSLEPYEYIHVKDRNKNITRVEEGPQTFIPLEHELVVHSKPQKMQILSKREYCVVKNPVMRNEAHELCYDKYGQVKNLQGELEYRFYKDYSEPWPLYPGELLNTTNTQLTIVMEGAALKIRATRDFQTAKGENKLAGDVWLFTGLATYYPRVEESIIETIKACVIRKGQALRVKAEQEFTDHNGVVRKAGEEWLVRTLGKYLPNAHASIVNLQDSIDVTEDQALILRASQNFTDIYGIERRAGEEWLLKTSDTTSHILDVYEEKVSVPRLQILSEKQYAVIIDPWNQEKKCNNKGTKMIRKGKCSFFLYPGETMEGGKPKNVYVLNEKQAVLLKSTEKYNQIKISNPDRAAKLTKHFENGNLGALSMARNKKNGSLRAILKEEVSGLRDYEEQVTKFEKSDIEACIVPTERAPGDKWMQYGPMNYIPAVEVEVLEIVNEIPLDKNEGIYVRDTKTG